MSDDKIEHEVLPKAEEEEKVAPEEEAEVSLEGEDEKGTPTKLAPQKIEPPGDCERSSVQDVTGEIIKVRRFCIYVQFTIEGARPQVAGLFLGRAFVNNTSFLLDVCRSDQELSLLFPKGMKVSFDATKTGRLQHQQSLKEEDHGANSEKHLHNRRCEWTISLLVVGDNNRQFTNSDKVFQERLDWVQSHIFDVEPPKSEPPELADGDSWFVRAISMTASGVMLPHPDVIEPELRGRPGVVKELLRPTGGWVELDGSGEKVFFHRARVFFDDGAHFSVTLDLAQFLTPGTKVKVDCVKNEFCDAEGNKRVYFEDAQPEHLVALLVYMGEERPQVPKVIFEQAAAAIGSEKKEVLEETLAVDKKYYMARVIEFDPPGETGVEGGVAEIVAPTEQATLAHVKTSFRKFIHTNPEIRRVRFHRSRLFHLGTMLDKADLQYVLSPYAYGMGTFYCRVRPIKGDPIGEGDDAVRHEVSVGWKTSLNYSNMVTQTGLSFPCFPEDTLLYPRMFTFQGLKFCSREGMDTETYENVIEGQLPPRGLYFNGAEEGTEGYEVARVCDLIPGRRQHSAYCGFACIEAGENRGQRVYFERSHCSAFGFKLDKADLMNIMEQNELVFVKVDTKNNSGEQLRTKFRAADLWLGWPYKDEQTLQSIPSSERHKLLLYLENKNMSVKDFLAAVAGEAPPKLYVPFRKEENKATVVCLIHGGSAKVGAVAGIAKVDKGPLAGKLVYFQRRNVWVLGYNLEQADLTHIFIEGQKVSLEANEMLGTFESGKKKKQKQCQTFQGENVNHRATIVWTSKFRPRNDMQKTVPESSHVNNWLKKRRLDFAKFKQLVEGKLPAVPVEIATKNKTNMLKGGEEMVKAEEKKSLVEEVKASGAPGAAGVTPGPVFRHGAEAARICDIALAVTGPDDRRIRQIIKSDANAQMAFHIQKTLEQALESYKRSRQSPWERNKSQGAAATATPFTSNPAWAVEPSTPPRPLMSCGGAGMELRQQTTAVISPWANNGVAQLRVVSNPAVPQQSQPNWLPPAKSDQPWPPLKTPQSNFVGGGLFSGKRNIAQGQSEKRGARGGWAGHQAKRSKITK